MLPIVIVIMIISGVSYAGEIDTIKLPAQGSGMYSISQLYDYLIDGIPLNKQNGFRESLSQPASSMKNLKEFGDEISARLGRCDTVPSDVAEGKKFFCTNRGQWGIQSGTVPCGGTAPLLKTGQVIEYRHGDDGTYRKGIDFSYVDNGDGTVTDNVTGLMWPKNGRGAGCAYARRLTWLDARDWAENLVFAGYSDWRLPNVREFFSLVVTNRPSPPINTTFFINTIYGYHHSSYWTSTVYEPSTSPRFPLGSRYWSINFIVGLFDHALNSSKKEFVRAVREAM